MFQVLVLDDEYLIRSLILNSINWEFLGVSKVHEASNSREAMEIIQQNPIDVASVDISMQGENGLDVVEKLKEQQPSLRIMMFTGYDSFDYAKRAISLSVQDYLLKPFDEELYTKAMERCLRQAHTLRSDILKNSNVQLEKSFAPDSSQKIDKDTLVFIHFSQSLQPTNLSEAIVQRLLVLGAEFLGAFQRGWIFQIDTKGRYESSCLTILNELRNGWGLNGVGVYCPVTDRDNDLDSLLHFVEDSNQRLFYSHYLTVISTVVTDDPETSEIKQNIYLEFLSQKQKLEILVMSDRIDEIIDTLGSLFHLAKKGQVQPSLYRSTLLDLVSSLIDRMKRTYDIAMTPEKELSILQHFSHGEMGLYLNTVVKEILLEIKEYLPQRQITRAERLVSKGCKELERNYADPQICLNSVSAKLSMSPSYFSAIFKQVTGQGFQEYLEGIRMNHASQLLTEQPALTVSEISRLTGYTDPFYFSRRFKQHFGRSPKDFISKSKM